MKRVLILFCFLMCFNFALATQEEVRIICGGNEEVKILCNTQVEQLYQIPEPINISITFPTTADSTQHTIGLTAETVNNLATCNYSVDGGTNTSFGSAAHEFSSSISVADGNHFIDVWCRDTFNLNDSYHDSVSFYIYTETTGGGGSSSTITIPIKLYRIAVFGETWNFEEDIAVNVDVFDINGSYIDPTSVDIKVISNVTINSQSILRSAIGKYKGIFNIENTTLKVIELNVTVSEGNKIISEIYKVPTEKISTTEEFQILFTGAAVWFDEVWSEYKVMIYFLFLLIFFLIVAYWAYTAYKNI